MNRSLATSPSNVVTEQDQRIVDGEQTSGASAQFELQERSPTEGRRAPLYVRPRPTPRLGDARPAGSEALVSSTFRGATPDLFVLASHRMGYGPAANQRAEWNALGPNDEARFAAYLDQQLAPNSISDSDYVNRRTAAGFVTLFKSLTQLWVEYEDDPGGVTVSNHPQEESELDWFLRAIYSKRQLEQVMTEFWIDHFNAYSRESPSDSLWPDWVNTLRANCFGRFRTLLEASTKHSVMLYFLDQYTSTAGGPNENFSRELFELHAMGAENYLGVIEQEDVPPDGSGFPTGYVDDDVFATTQALAGWTYAGDSGGPVGESPGTFVYDNSKHDDLSERFILGTNIDDHLGMGQGMQVLDLLAFHPGTARFISRKLCRKLISDDPPQSLVDSAAALFVSAANDADQVGQVVRHILESAEFRTSFGLKMKRPFDMVTSLLRATESHLDWRLGGDEMSSFMWRMELTGHRPFRWRAPDGFPDFRQKWETASPRVMTWRMGQWLCSVRDLASNLYMPINARTPGSVPRTPNALADYWIDRLLARPMSAAYREEIVDFLGQGYNPNQAINLADSEVEERVQMMIALIMASPEFSER